MPQPEMNQLSTLHQDIITTHVLPRLDGLALASAAASSASFRDLSSSDDLWSDICYAAWPSTLSPRVNQVVSSGPRAFFSHAFPLPTIKSSNLSHSSTSLPPELISAVDIHYDNKIIFSKVQETETSSAWFLCSPFRIDMLEPKDVVPTPIKHVGEDTCTDINKCMKLSWIVLDLVGRHVVNLSSHKPVSVNRHWLTGELHVRFASILTARQGGHVQCGIVVTCGESEGMMHVREVCMEMENMDGMHLNGNDSLVILHGVMKGKKGSGRNREQEAKRRYNEYVEMKRERKERKVRMEETLDMLSVAFGISVSLVCMMFFFGRYLA